MKPRMTGSATPPKFGPSTTNRQLRFCQLKVEGRAHVNVETNPPLDPRQLPGSPWPERRPAEARTRLMPGRRPNILFIVPDDHQASAFGCAGDRNAQTPVLDALAARGVRFANAWHMGGDTAALCVPARAALLTGRSVYHVLKGPEMWGPSIDPTAPLLPERFRRAGWQTHLCGKWHNDTAALNRAFEQGGPIFLGGMSDHDRVPVHPYDPTGAYPESARSFAAGHSTDVFTQGALEFLENRDRHRPFFLWLAYTSPHDPRTPPRAFAERFQPERMALPPNFLPRHPFDHGQQRVRDEMLEAYPRTPAAIQRHLADYHGMIAHHDHALGRVLESLRRSGDLENTIVVYVGDHGLALGQHGLMGKQNLYEHSLKVPLIVAGPGIATGRVRRDAVYSWDIHATLCDLADVPCEEIASRSLRRAVEDGGDCSRPLRGAAYFDLQRAASDGRWKLIRFAQDPRFGGTEAVRLFDLEEDPWELQDRTQEQPDRLRSMDAALSRWCREFGVSTFPPL
jgi:arylsulfatase A-like enzyme